MEGTVAHQGTKRKRYEPQQDLGAKIKGKLHHDLKEVKKAAKKAKTFETQKLIKKLKDFRKNVGNSDDISEAENQLELLKDLDHELVAITALKTKLNKVRILHENEHVHAAISQELTATIVRVAPGITAAKVQSRLLSSKILATEIANVVQDLKNAIQSKDNAIDTGHAEDETAPDRPKKLKKVDGDKDNAPSSHSQSVEGLRVTTDEEGFEEEASNDAGWESGTVDGGEEELQDGWESGTVDDGEEKQQDGWEFGSILGADENDSAEESDDDEDESLIAPASPRKARPSKAPPPKAPAKSTGLQSTFLPSLSVGFTRGESDDSDLSESEVKVADIDIKKNRRGQRARRAIWEKKYGRNANHKKKEAESSKEALGQGSQRRHPGNGTHASNRPYPKGSARPSDTKTVPQHRQEADKGWGQRAAAPHGPVPQRSASSAGGRKAEKPIHPSWEAKRKLKEKERATIVPSQGKKIKFS